MRTDESLKRSSVLASPQVESDPVSGETIEDKDIKRIFDGVTLARYKIEVMVGPDRSVFKDFKALVSLHESGKHFHGGGDAGMYLCMDHRIFESSTTSPSALPLLREMSKTRTEHGCGSPIPNAAIVSMVANCPGCGNLIITEHLTGQIPYFGGIAGLVEMLEILFHRLKDNADIYLKHAKYDIRFDPSIRSEFKKVVRARANIEKSIYPLYRLIQDLAGGTALPNAFRSFLLS